MYNVKGLLFLSLLFFQLIFICGQTDCANIYYGNLCYPRIDTVKLNIYESILFSKEIKNDRKCHIVTIKPRALHTSYVQNYGFYKTKEVEDTTSVKNLRKKLPESYSIYSINDDLANSIESQEYLRYLNNIEREKSQDTLHVEKFLYEDICENRYDIIKIQAPLDSWAKVYKANILLNKASVIIPVIYESFIDKPKYLLYKIELYKGSTKVKIKDDKIEFLENIPDEDIINEIREQLRDIFKKGKYTITYEYKYIIGEKGISIDIFKKQPKKRYSILGGIIGAFIQN